MEPQSIVLAHFTTPTTIIFDQHLNHFGRGKVFPQVDVEVLFAAVKTFASVGFDAHVILDDAVFVGALVTEQHRRVRYCDPPARGKRFPNKHPLPVRMTAYK
jgi:hypothetical protein